MKTDDCSAIRERTKMAAERPRISHGILRVRLCVCFSNPTNPSKIEPLFRLAEHPVNCSAVVLETRALIKTSACIVRAQRRRAIDTAG